MKDADSLDPNDPLTPLLRDKVGGKNPIYSCRICSYSHCHRVRFIDHILKNHMNQNSIKLFFDNNPEEYEHATKRIKHEVKD